MTEKINLFFVIFILAGLVFINQNTFLKKDHTEDPEEMKEAPKYVCFIKAEMLNRHDKNILGLNEILVETRETIDGAFRDFQVGLQCSWGEGDYLVKSIAFKIEKDGSVIDKPEDLQYVTDLSVGKKIVSLNAEERPTCFCTILTEYEESE